MNKTVLIADKQYVAVEGLAFILKSISEDILIHRVYTAHELMEKIMEHEYDLLILDSNLLQESLDITIKQIKKLSPSLKVLIFAACKEDAGLHYLYQEGSSGCLQIR
ncbi:response regulator [Chryseobacterium fistulae]|uniref:Response regulatory domain-containing protein n=1 Tax=Chryseobacterium fistulae TaxID=2675058 RepID=A0A6N4XW82_9FLAO|nr:response regulator [Chryseobacterium fistulae]CAA7392618.1 hypothetical protein CHRY9393_03343 [Chryseobacterium fistulae]